MAEWRHRVKIRHLMVDEKDHESVQNCMSSIAAVLEASPAFAGFSTKLFRNIPVGDDVFGPQDYANKLLDHMYDFADDNRIWIE